MVRTPCCDKFGMRKGSWTPEEDGKLTAYVTRYGCWNWRQLPKFAGLSRCGKSCRLRWMNYLRPNLKRGDYTKEEDELIIKLHESLGNRWSAIAAHLPGRTDNEIKNHWHTTLKKTLKQKQTSGESKRLSKSNSSRKRRRMEVEEENSNQVPFVREILESSEFSLKPSSLQASSENLQNLLSLPSVSEMSSSSGTTSSAAETVTFLDDFWTEPFLTESYSGINYPPSSPFSSEEFLCSFGFYEEHVNDSLIW